MLWRLKDLWKVLYNQDLMVPIDAYTDWVLVVKIDYERC
jgi:hypothetical protein